MSTKPTAVKSNANAKAAADLLSDLNELVPATAKPKAGAKQKWEIELKGPEAENFKRWIEAKQVDEVVKTRLENSKDELCEYALTVIADAMWKSKTRPVNPVLKVTENGKTDSFASFVFMDKFKYRFPEVPDGVRPRDHFVSTLVDFGLEQQDAENLVDNELDLNPVVGFRQLTELLSGVYGEGRTWIESSEVEKSAGKKLLAYFKAVAGDGESVTVEALTPEERAVALKRDPGIKVKAGFYSRVCSYVHSPQQLLAVFKVIVPIAYPRDQKYAVNDTPEGRANRLVKAAADIIGVSVVSNND